jgi:hypothetical protein
MRVTQHGVSSYPATCDECGCRFEYTRSDVHQNFIQGGEYVHCPDCGYPHRHFGVSSSQGSRTA